jgi:hypothetical protein
MVGIVDTVGPGAARARAAPTARRQDWIDALDIHVVVAAPTLLFCARS